MFRCEFKRILQSKIFIILLVLTLMYFVYLTVIWFNRSEINRIKKTSEETNSFIAESISQLDGQNNIQLHDGLEQELKELDAWIFTYINEHEDELHTYAEEHDGLWPPMPPEYLEKQARWDIVYSSFHAMDYQYYEYPQLVQATLIKAFTAISSSQTSKYTVRLNQKAVDTYNIVKDFSLLDTSPLEYWMSKYTMAYDIFYIVLAIAFLFLATDVFCYENTKRLEGIVFTTKYGRKKLFSSKLISLLAIAFSVMLIFTVVDICLAYYCMGSQLINEPIQALSDYKSCVFNITILEFILCCNMLRYLVLVLVICVSAAISQLSRKVYISTVINIILMFCMFALFIHASRFEVTDLSNFESEDFSAITTYYGDRFVLFEKLRSLLPSCLTRPYLYFEKFDYINVANYPITRLTTCLTVTIALTLVFTVFAYFRFGNVLKFIPYKTKDIAKVKEAK